MARMVHGVLYVPIYNSTLTPGEYTFTNAVYENQADATGNGSLDIQVGFVLFVPATDVVSAEPIPGITHRYRIISIQGADGIHLSATIVWDEDSPEVDTPTLDSYAIIGEDTPNHSFGLIPSNDVYINLPAGMAESAYSNDLRRITDKLGSGGFGSTGAQGQTGIQGVTGILGGGTGVQGPQGTTGAYGGPPGETGLPGPIGLGLTGAQGIQGFTGLIGLTGTPGIRGSTGFIGLTGAQGVTGGVGISYGSELPMGTPSDASLSDGMFPWESSTTVTDGLDDVNEILLAIAPTPPTALSGTLTLAGTTKYSAILPTGLDSAWYQDSKVAGNTITDYIVDNTYTLTTPSTTTSFKCGSTFGGDEGTVYSVLDGTNDSSRDITSGEGTTDNIQITSIATYNTIWRKANARINYTQTAEGYKYHAIRYQTSSVNQISSDTKVWYDNANTAPSITTPTITQNSLVSSRYLSGVRYYSTSDTFTTSSTVSSIANKCIRPTNPIAYSFPGISNTNIAIDGASFAYNADYTFNPGITIASSNVYSINAQLTVTGTKPNGSTSSATSATENRLINTYATTTYSSNGDIHMFDEEYRWTLSTDFSAIPGSYSDPTGDWNSSTALSNGNGMLYNSTWYYPQLNYSSGYLPSQAINYSTFSGDQVIVWASNIGVAHSSMTITFTGINYTGISASGTGDLNVEVRLPNETDWLDCGKSFGNGNGCRNDGSSSGSLLAITFGTDTSTSSNGVVFIRVTLRTTSAGLASRMVIVGT